MRSVLGTLSGSLRDDEPHCIDAEWVSETPIASATPRGSDGDGSDLAEDEVRMESATRGSPRTENRLTNRIVVMGPWLLEKGAIRRRPRSGEHLFHSSNRVAPLVQCEGDTNSIGKEPESTLPVLAKRNSDTESRSPAWSR